MRDLHEEVGKHLERLQVPLTEIRSVIKESLATGEFRSEPIALRLCLESACAQALKEQVNVQIHGPTEILIQGSEDLLFQAFEELVRNAVHWMTTAQQGSCELT